MLLHRIEQILYRKTKSIIERIRMLVNKRLILLLETFMLIAPVLRIFFTAFSPVHEFKIRSWVFIRVNSRDQIHLIQANIQTEEHEDGEKHNSPRFCSCGNP